MIRMRLAATLLLLFLSSTTATADATSGLADSKAQKAVVKCQKAITQGGAKLVAAKLKSLDACSTAVLSCIQTKPGVVACTEMAAAKCSKALLDAIPQAEVALTAKIVKSCGAPLRPADLLAADGLGIGARAATCNVDFGLNVCSSLPALAQCLVDDHGRSAERLFAAEQPRAGELIATVLSPLPLADLPVFPGCSDCAQAPSDPTGKAIAQCGAAMTKAGRSFAAAVQKGLASCVSGVFACLQTKPGNAKCLAKATKACDGVLAKLSAARTKLSAGIDKRCADATLLPFATLAAATALNLDVLADDCTALGGGVATLDDYVACVGRQHECRVASVIRNALPRVAELIDAGTLGGVGTLLDPAGCPSSLPSESSSLVRSAPASRFLSFFTMSRFFSMSKKLKNGPFLKATTVSARAPTSSTNSPRRIFVSSAPNRFVPGSSQIVKVRYTAFSPKAATTARAAAAPTMIVTARRDDFVVTDHLELPLEAVPPGGEGEIELEVDYDADPPSCVFDLAFAVSDGAEVSDYTAIEQVSDTVPPPTATPTPTATGGATPSATVTPVPPTITPTPGGTPGGGDLAYALRTDDDPVAPGGTASLTLSVTNLTNAPQNATLTFTVPPFTNFGGFGPGSVRGVVFNNVAPGASQSTIVNLTVSNGASAPPDGTTISVTFNDTARGASVSRSFVTDASPAATLALSTADATVPPGGAFTYALAFANVGIDPLANAELSIVVPTGATFVGAEGGVVPGLDGVVRWPLGTLSGNTAGQRTITFAAAANAQAPLVVAATLASNTAPLAHASAATAVYANPVFAYSLTTVDDAVEPGGTAVYRVTVTNLSNATQDATLAFRVPDFMTFGGFVAGALRSVTFTGVPSGGSESALIPLVVTSGAAAPPDGTVIPFAVQDTARGIVASRAIVARSTPPAELTLATAYGTVTAGGAFRYTLAYSNPGVQPLDAVELSVRVPKGASFTAATEGGAPDADGVVRWQLGALAGNSSGQRTVTFTAKAGARGPLVVEAALESAPSGEVLTQASAATTVRATPAFAYTLTTDDDAVRPGGTAVFRVTVTNLTNAAQDATLAFRVPDFTSFGGFQAGAVRGVSFAGVAAGASESALLTFVVTTGAAAPPDGSVIGFAVDDTARGVAVSRTIVADASPAAELTLATTAGTVAPGGTFAYTLAYTNPGIAPLPSTELTVRVPDGASVVAADEDVAPDADGILRWPIGTVPGNGTGERTVTFAAAAGARAPLLVEADVHDGSTQAIRTQASAATTVYATPAFAYRVTTTDDDPIKPGRTATFLVTATNLTNAAQSATVQFRVPDFTSFGGFTAGAVRGLTFTDVPAGGSQSQLVPLLVTSGASAPPDGTVIGFGIDDTARGAAVSRTIVAESAGHAELKLSTPAGTVQPSGPFVYTVSFHNTQVSAIDGAELVVPVPAGASFVSADGGVTPDADGGVRFPLGTFAGGATGARTVTFAADAAIKAPLLVEAELHDASGDVLAHASATMPVYTQPTFAYVIGTASDTVSPGPLTFNLVITNLTNTPQTPVVTFRVPDFTTFGGFVAGAVRPIPFDPIPANGASPQTPINLTVTSGVQAPPSGTLIDLTTIDGAHGASVSKTVVVN